MDFSFITDEALRQQAELSYKAEQDEQQKTLGAVIEQKVNEATKGLKTKTDELLAEKKKLQEKYKDINDPSEALLALKFITENEDVRMIKEGKFEEVIEKRVGNIRSDFESKFTELNSTLTTEQQKAQKFESLYQRKTLEDALRSAAVQAKVRPEAVEDVVKNGLDVFSLGEDLQSVEARDSKGKLRKTEDDKILTTNLWVDGLKKVKPHYWPQSESANFDNTDTSDDIEKAMNRAADSGNTTEYRRLKGLLAKARGGK